MLRQDKTPQFHALHQAFLATPLFPHLITRTESGRTQSRAGNLLSFDPLLVCRYPVLHSCFLLGKYLCLKLATPELFIDSKCICAIMCSIWLVSVDTNR